MSNMPRARWDVRGGLCVTDHREGSNVFGVPAEAGRMPRVRSGRISRIADDKFSEPAQHIVGLGDRGGGRHPPTP